MMINYKTFYILQHGQKFLVLDEDKMPIDVQETLASAKHLIDLITSETFDVEEISK